MELQNIKQRFGIIGNYVGLNRAIDIAVQVAPTDLSVLITGDSGTGKEVFPQVIHNYSARKHGQYISQSTVVQSLKVQSIQNCSDMRRDHLLVPLIAEKDILKLPMVEPYSLMRSLNFLSQHR